MQYGYCLLNMQPFPVLYQFQPLSNTKELKQPHHAVKQGDMGYQKYLSKQL